MNTFYYYKLSVRFADISAKNYITIQHKERSIPVNFDGPYYASCVNKDEREDELDGTVSESKRVCQSPYFVHMLPLACGKEEVPVVSHLEF
jgi:hypothetical protein